MNRSFIPWICGAVAAFLAIAASANPPTYKFTNRTYGNSVGAGGCSDFEGGYRCREIHVWENYNVKGTFEYTEAHYQTEGHQWDPIDGSYENRWRYVTCPVDDKSIAANPGHVTIDVVLDTEGPGCYQWGYREGWNPSDGYYWEPHAFAPGVRIFRGEWREPFSYGSQQWNGNYKYYQYDGWSGSDWKEHNVNHCSSRWGDMMTSGGFTTIGVTGRVRTYEFDGPDGPTWGSYHVSRCNDRNTQK